MAGEPELIKVRLTDRGADSETPWAHDLGPAPGPPGSRKVRLVNVPFLHAKPTWGDVIIVSPVEDDFLLWDRGGVPWEQIGTRIAEDGGRWAMIVDYAPHPGSEDAYGALSRACAEHDIVCEGAWGPRDGKPGRAYLAVRHELDDAAVMARLRGAALPCDLIQIHPAPAALEVGTTAAATAPAAANAIVARPTRENAATKPAATKPAATKPAVTKPVVTKPVATKPVATKPAEPKPVAPKPAATKPAVTKPVVTKSVATKPAATKPAATKPAATKPALTKSIAPEPHPSKASASRRVTAKATAANPAGSKVAASKGSTAKKSAGTRPAAKTSVAKRGRASSSATKRPAASPTGSKRR